MKYCAKCGNANVDEAVFCSSCGSPLEQAPVAPQPAPEPVVSMPAAPQQSAYTAPAYDASAYSAPAAAPVGETKNKATLWLILNIVSTVLCCGGVLTIIGIIMAAMGMGSYKRGDYEEMNKKSKISMIMFIIGTILGVIAEIVFIVLAISGAFASIFNNGWYY